MSNRAAGDAPFWWYRDTTSWRAQSIATALSPLAALYGAIAARRLRRRPGYRAAIPVICVGNFTAGGTGKTPLVRSICDLARSAGTMPVILTRGYGGSIKGPHRVDPAHDRASDVGDEPLLLARATTVIVSADRAAGARYIEALTPAPALIVMDDGLQNPALAKDLTIAVVDRVRSIGNGRIIPAGPLRAPLADQLSRTDVVALMSPPDATGTPAALPALKSFRGQRVETHITASGDVRWLQGARVVAFAGIGAPERFFAMIEQLGGTLIERIAYPDHHAFTDADAIELRARAKSASAVLVTTEKDGMRLAHATGDVASLGAECRILTIELALPDDLKRVIRELLARTTLPHSA